MDVENVLMIKIASNVIMITAYPILKIIIHVWPTIISLEPGQLVRRLINVLLQNGEERKVCCHLKRREGF